MGRMGGFVSRGERVQAFRHVDLVWGAVWDPFDWSVPG